MNMSYKQIAKWKKERDEAIKSLDIRKFKKFYYKWFEKGIYEIGLPSDDIVEVTIYKMLYNLKSSTEEEKELAKNWLKERGASTKLY